MKGSVADTCNKDDHLINSTSLSASVVKPV